MTDYIAREYVDDDNQPRVRYWAASAKVLDLVSSSADSPRYWEPNPALNMTASVCVDADDAAHVALTLVSAGYTLGKDWSELEAVELREAILDVLNAPTCHKSCRERDTVSSMYGDTADRLVAFINERGHRG